MNDFADINFVNVPSSYFGRYTMEFYVYIKDSTLLTSGVNLIWKNHMAISIISDPVTPTSLKVMCFPQEYRSQVDGSYGSSLLGLILTTVNIDNYSYALANQTWIWIRCGYSQNNKLFYLSPNVEKTVVSEMINTNTNSNNPFRLFNSGSSKFIIQRPSFNPVSKIYINHVYLYNDYLPTSFNTANRM